MLYEVITGKTQLAGVVDIEATGGAFHIKAASMETKQKYRITSYNVCYTKLLRTAQRGGDWHQGQNSRAVRPNEPQ